MTEHNVTYVLYNLCNICRFIYINDYRHRCKPIMHVDVFLWICIHMVVESVVMQLASLKSLNRLLVTTGSSKVRKYLAKTPAFVWVEKSTCPKTFLKKSKRIFLSWFYLQSLCLHTFEQILPSTRNMWVEVPGDVSPSSCSTRSGRMIETSTGGLHFRLLVVRWS